MYSECFPPQRKNRIAYAMYDAVHDGSGLHLISEGEAFYLHSVMAMFCAVAFENHSALEKILKINPTRQSIGTVSRSNPMQQQFC